MPTPADVQSEHRELLALARSMTPSDPVTPAAAERIRQRLATFRERLASHFCTESGTITGLCQRGGGALAVACTIRQQEMEGLAESMAGIATRWGAAGAIERDPRGFGSIWEVLISALQRLQQREEGDIYPTAGSWGSAPLRAPLPTGLPGIDRDHEQLFAMIGGLRAAVGGGMQFIDGRMASELASYTERHMADEEAIMEATGYAGLEDHRREHHLAQAILLGFRNDYLDGRHVEAASVLEFLERWLGSHIAVVDQAMARHALDAGWRA